MGLDDRLGEGEKVVAARVADRLAAQAASEKAVSERAAAADLIEAAGKRFAELCAERGIRGDPFLPTSETLGWRLTEELFVTVGGEVLKVESNFHYDTEYFSLGVPLARHHVHLSPERVEQAMAVWLAEWATGAWASPSDVPW